MLQDTAREQEEQIIDLEKRQELKIQESRELANTAIIITSQHDLESIFANTMEIAMRQVTGETGAVVQIVNGMPEVRVSCGIDPAIFDSLIYKDNLDIVRYCQLYRKTIYENNCIRRFPGQVSIRNFICFPIMARGQVFAVMVIFNKTTDIGFTDEDVQVLEITGNFASVAIENAILLKESVEMQNVGQEPDLGQQIQAIFHPNLIDFEGLKIVASHVPAREVGGDYYDLIPISGNRLFLLIGDVSHKGVPAVLVMTSVYSIVRAYIRSQNSIDVTMLISQLNEILCRDIIRNQGMFITLFAAVLDLENGRMEYCNGGHPPPFYYRAANPEVIPLKCGGPIIGQFRETTYKSTTIEVGQGDRIFCYTDGLIEASNGEGQLFGLNRLERYFREHLSSNTDKFGRGVKNEINSFSRGTETEAESIDDYTTLVVDIGAPEDNPQSYEYVFASRLDSLKEMHVEIDKIARENAVAEEIIHPFRVAVSEAVTNAIVHAHGGDSTKKIRFAVDLDSEKIRAVVTDQGTSTGKPLLDGADPVRELDAEGGRGLGLIKRLSDEVNFEWLPEGGLQVTIVKYF